MTNDCKGCKWEGSLITDRGIGCHYCVRSMVIPDHYEPVECEHEWGNWSKDTKHPAKHRHCLHSGCEQIEFWEEKHLPKPALPLKYETDDVYENMGFSSARIVTERVKINALIDYLASKPWEEKK